jgi:DNA-binding response OmpR family regulator
MTSMSVAAPLILLVEDEPIIGYEIESTLRSDGYEVAGPMRSVTTAIEAAARADITLAIVDMLLTDGPSDALVEHLLARGIPVVVTSGLNEQAQITERCAGWLVKPYDPERLRHLVRQLVPCP